MSSGTILNAANPSPLPSATGADCGIAPVAAEAQVKSRQRVADHGEVLTAKREVNAMLDLVKAETERIESRFLEPACGDGNFLAVILERKLDVVERRYSESQLEFERYAVLAVSAIYGIDLLEDNVRHCRQRLQIIFEQCCTRLFKAQVNVKCCAAVRFLLERNIIWGDALDLKTRSEPRRPIVFSEWSPVNGSLLKRRDFMLSFMLEKQHQLLLFSDEGDVADLNTPVKDFELLVSLDLFNSGLMNDAVFKFKRYEDSSLSYTGINRHEGEDIGGYDTVLTHQESQRVFANMSGT